MARSARTLTLAVLLALALLAPPAGAQAPPDAPAAAGPAGVVLDGDPASTERVNEGEPVALAVEVSRQRFDAAGGERAARHAILARADDFSDSLAGSGLTADGPLLFTSTGELPVATRDELARLLPPDGLVYLLGGEAAISAGVERFLTETGWRVERLAGRSRVETAIAVADEVVALAGDALGEGPDPLLARAYGTPGNRTAGWADAVAGGGYAAAAGAPLLVTGTEELHPAVDAWLDEHVSDDQRTVLLGGTAALSDAVEAAVPEPVRIAGAERTATAAAVATELWGVADDGARRALVVNGARSDGWASGLVAAGLAADDGAPVLLTTSLVPRPTAELLATCGDPEVDLGVVGDDPAVPRLLERQLDALDGGACGGEDGSELQAALASIGDCDDVLDLFHERALAELSDYGLPYGYGTPVNDVVVVQESASADAATAAPESGSAPAPRADSADTSVGASDGVSQTNVQEAGVDEPDLVKTDGRVALVADGRALRVVDLTADPPALAASVDLRGSDPQGFYGSSEILLESRTALVLTPTFGPSASSAQGSYDYLYGSPLRTALTLIDVGDPAAPRVLDRLEVDGGYVSARMVEGTVRVVVQSGADAIPFTYPTDDSAGERERAQAENEAAIRATTLADWLPDVYRVPGGEEASTPLLDCRALRQPPVDAGLVTSSVFTLELGQELAITSSTGVLASAETVYASPERLYVATNQWVSETPQPGAAPPPPSGAPVTQLHAFDISDPDAVTYTASGVVPGYLLSRYSLGEFEEHLRVATTTGGFTDATQSGVTVLADEAGVLTPVGKVDGLGEGEEITAVRFLGDLGLVVTFRQVDPLFVLDLADPTAPRVTGELKIPGFSEYLHRVGEDLILGVGQDADTETGRTQGAAVSLFDIADRSAPRLVDRVTYGQDTFSSVGFDPRAFLYWEPSALALVPIRDYSQEADAFASAVRVAPDGVEEAARLAPVTAGSYPAVVLRSFVADGQVFVVSADGIAAADLETLEPRSSTPFPSEEDEGASTASPSTAGG